MGNCVFKGFGETEQKKVKVVTSNGGIMELYAPITAQCITTEFPGYALFRTPDLFSQPLLHTDDLQAGHLYYLLPINQKLTPKNNAPNSSIKSSVSMPYRMSVENQRMSGKRTEGEVLGRYNSKGVWKVKLVISPAQLAEILAQEARTEALIESVRTVAKCGTSGVSSVANSDQWSVSSSWKGFISDH